MDQHVADGADPGDRGAYCRPAVRRLRACGSGDELLPDAIHDRSGVARRPARRSRPELDLRPHLRRRRHAVEGDRHRRTQGPGGRRPRVRRRRPREGNAGHRSRVRPPWHALGCGERRRLPQRRQRHHVDADRARCVCAAGRRHGPRHHPRWQSQRRLELHRHAAHGHDRRGERDHVDHRRARRSGQRGQPRRHLPLRVRHDDRVRQPARRRSRSRPAPRRRPSAPRSRPRGEHHLPLPPRRDDRAPARPSAPTARSRPSATAPRRARTRIRTRKATPSPSAPPGSPARGRSAG